MSIFNKVEYGRLKPVVNNLYLMISDPRNGYWLFRDIVFWMSQIFITLFSMVLLWDFYGEGSPTPISTEGFESLTIAFEIWTIFIVFGLFWLGLLVVVPALAYVYKSKGDVQ